MRPLQPAKHVPTSKKRMREIARAYDLTMREVRKVFSDCVRNERLWLNDVYQVSERRFAHPSFGECAHLSIKRIDREPVTDWRDKQSIKNQLVGPECEGFELYPAESRLVDTANQYHLWVICDPTERVPFGFDEGRRVANVSAGGAKQRPLDDEGESA